MRTWQKISDNAVCNAPTAYLPSGSRGRVRSVEACQTLCENTSGCQGISYFRSGWCSLYSAPCTTTRRRRNTKTFTLVTVDLESSQVSLQWKRVSSTLTGLQVECDTKAGEVYLQTSPRKVDSLSECQESCIRVPKCMSITFFNSGYCSHFGTTCVKTKKHKNAQSYRLTVDLSGF